VTTAVIPNRPVFRAQEVCEIAQVQPYVLRSWEAEFPDLGTSRSGQRVYRRTDVERVLRLKHLLFSEGLTLAGARRRLTEEAGRPAEPPIADSDLAALLDEEIRESLRDVRRGLQWVLGVLSGGGLTPVDRVLATEATRPRETRTARRSPARQERRKPARASKSGRASSRR
jgi:DNA-binding transcriptional MerR regulator